MPASVAGESLGDALFMKRVTVVTALAGALLYPQGAAHADIGTFHVSQLAPMVPGDALTAISASGPDNVWSIGFQAYAKLPTPIIIDGSPLIWDAFSAATQRWTGSGWRQQNPSGLLPGFTQMKHVSAATPQDVWVSGQSAEPFIKHWNGSSWSDHSGVYPGGGRPASPMRITAAPGGTAWAIGSGAGNQVFHWTGTAWENTPLAGPVDSIVVRSANDAWAVAAYGLWHWDGTTWSHQDTPLEESTRRTPHLALGPSGSVWLGLSGYRFKGEIVSSYLYRFSGGEWTTTELSPDVNVSRFVVDGSDTPWTLMGNGRTIGRWNGTEFEPATMPSTPQNIELQSITAVPGTTTIWAVGAYKRGPQPTDLSSVTLTND